MLVYSVDSLSCLAVRLGLHGTLEAQGNDLICGHIESQVTRSQVVNILCASDASNLIRLCQNTTNSLLRINMYMSTTDAG